MKAGCIQEIMTFIAPKIIGGVSSMNPFSDFEFTDMDEVFNLDNSEISFVGDDIFVKNYLIKLEEVFD